MNTQPSDPSPPGSTVKGVSNLQSLHRQIAQMTLIALLIIGCFLIFLPFLAAALLAAVVVISTWAIHEWLLARLRGRKAMTSVLMVLVLVLVFFLPMTYLAANAAQSLTQVTEWIRVYLHAGLPAPPRWLGEIPVLGESIVEYWQGLTSSREEMLKILNLVYQPMSRFLVSIALASANAVLQVALVLFICYFFYRDGHAIARVLSKIASKLGGETGVGLLQLSQNTISGVMVGIAGTALGQSIVALIGFWIAGVPNAPLLAMGIFMVSVLPIGPPLFWGGAAAWLYVHGHTGWSIFMVAWGLLAISGVDNFLKPILISRKAKLPLLLIALGVFGGIFAFGFIGMFLGPTLLAVAYVLVQKWIEGGANAESTPQ